MTNASMLKGLALYRLVEKETAESQPCAGNRRRQRRKDPPCDKENREGRGRELETYAFSIFRLAGIVACFCTLVRLGLDRIIKER